jgi:hypothetical protein
MGKVFDEITAKKLPYVGKVMDIQVQEAYRTPNRWDQKIISLCCIIVKMPSLDNKERI